VRLSKSWVVASKDLKTLARKKNILASMLIIPLVVSISFPAIIAYVLQGTGVAAELTPFRSASTLFFLGLAALVPSTVASYSLVGEKAEKSFEPLLATPTTDDEILLGKGIAAFIPPTAVVLGAAVLFMVLMDLVTRGPLGYYFFPNTIDGIVLLIMVPIGSAMSVEWNVIVSARSSDVRTSLQVGSLITLPMLALFYAGEGNIIELNSANLLMISGVLLLVAVLLAFISRATFQREQILTKWK
jgi:ABC-2 type transport system permease protein